MAGPGYKTGGVPLGVIYILHSSPCNPLRIHLSIMRFLTLVAFMLPLSALAAPSLVRRALADKMAHKNLDDSLQDTSDALDQIINFPIPEPLQNQKLIQTVQLAKRKITKAIAGEKKVALKIAAGQEVKEEEYVDTFTGVACTAG